MSFTRQVLRSVLVTLLTFAVSVAAVSPAHAGPTDGRLDIYWNDVEGGASTLIVTPAGQTVLIDTGNAGHRDPDRITRTLTQQAGMRRIDNLIITHYHGDHFGGASTLATMLPIGTVYDNGVFDGMPNDPGKEYFHFKCDRRVVIQPGDKIPLKKAEGSPEISLTCLGTRQTFIDPPAGAADNRALGELHKPKDRDGSDNANSVVMLLKFGPFVFYDAGDLTWNQEVKLVHPYDLVGPVDVYQVTHHGLDSSNNPIVLQTVQPTVAVMNNGHKKGCLPEVCANLKDTASIQAVYQMHKNLRPDGAVNNVPDEYIANLEEKCDGNIIKLSVAPDGKTYSVSIPANKHQREFKTRKK